MFENPHISDVISAGYDTDAVAYGLYSHLRNPLNVFFVFVLSHETRL